MVHSFHEATTYFYFYFCVIVISSHPRNMRNIAISTMPTSPTLVMITDVVIAAVVATSAELAQQNFVSFDPLSLGPYFVY